MFMIILLSYNFQCNYFAGYRLKQDFWLRHFGKKESLKILKPGIYRSDIRANLDYREGQTDSIPVDKYNLTFAKKAFNVILNFNYR